MPHVADKYRPVQPTVHTTHPPAAVIGALWAVGLGLALWAAPDVHAQLEAKQSPLAPASAWLVAFGEGIGLPEVRGGIERAAAAVADWPRFAERPPPPPEPEPEPEPVGPDEPVSWRGLEPPSRRVLVVGASTINSYLGSELRRALEQEYGLYAVRDGRLGTGLVRNDVFDWPAHLASIVDEHEPDLVIANFGGNDAQPIQTPAGKIPFGREGWDEAYASRVAGMVRATEEAGAEVVWVGMGVVKEPGFSERLRRLDRILASTVTEAGGVFVEQADLTAAADGAYKVDVRFDGQAGLMHMSDGVHLSRLGAKSVVHGLLPRLERAAPLLSVDEGAAVVSRLDLDSEVRGEPAPAMLVVPREIPAGGLPLVYMLHGAWDGWEIWSEKAHDELQALATKHQLILAMPDGRPFGWYLNSPNEPTNQMVTWFAEEQRPTVEGAVPHNGRIGLLGISMGGHGALNYALDDPGAYGAISSLSGAVDLTFAESRTQLQGLLGPLDAHREAWESRSALHRLRAHEGAFPPVSLVCGTEDIWYPSNQALAEVLGSRARTEWVEGKGHEWSLWLDALDGELAWQAEILRR